MTLSCMRIPNAVQSVQDVFSPTEPKFEEMGDGYIDDGRVVTDIVALLAEAAGSVFKRDDRMKKHISLCF